MKIAVVVPVYKVEPYLRKCVDSILSQTYREFELILVDDGSPDRCGDICDEYARQDSRVKVIHQKNGGLSAARNAGIDSAICVSDVKAITFVDSDDWLLPDALQVMSDGLSSGADVACNIVARIYDSGRIETRYPVGKWHAGSPMKYWMRPDWFKDSACAKLYDVKVFKGVRFPAGKINEDIFTTYKLIFNANSVAWRDYPSYRYRVREGSITTNATYVTDQLVSEAYIEQSAYFRTHGCDKLADIALGNALAARLSVADSLADSNPTESRNAIVEVHGEFKTRHPNFWECRALYRRFQFGLFLLRWPFAMLWNACCYRENSWLIRECIPTVCCAVRNLLVR